MGVIIAKFKKKKTTYETLEKLENEIKSIEEFRRNTEQTQKKMVGRFVFISVCVYCITALIFYLYFFPATAYERIIYIIPLIIFPMLLMCIKIILTWYYNRKLRKNQNKLINLKNEKKKILEDVMDKETYKVAKSILEKFAPESVKKNTLSTSEITPLRSGPLTSFSLTPQTGLRYRGQLTNPASRLTFGTTLTPRPSGQRPFSPALIPPLPLISQSQTVMSSVGSPTISGTPSPLPRAILPRDRSVLDKMVDYLVGDGPSNRYALICKSCSSHNGMALQEEFDYLSFKCCYCGVLNLSRKKRPAAPRLPTPLSITNKVSEVSDSDQHSPIETDSEPDTEVPIITEPSDDIIADSAHAEKAANLPDSDKLSDVEIKSSDTESSVMDVDLAPPTSEENEDQQLKSGSDCNPESEETNED